MTQKNSVIMFLTGLVTFLGSLAEFFSVHKTWHEMASPIEVAHILFMTVTFLMTLLGALSYQIPRDPNDYTHNDRESDRPK
jgi:hypothetical protein